MNITINHFYFLFYNCSNCNHLFVLFPSRNKWIVFHYSVYMLQRKKSISKKITSILFYTKITSNVFISTSLKYTLVTRYWSRNWDLMSAKRKSSEKSKLKRNCNLDSDHIKVNSLTIPSTLLNIFLIHYTLIQNIAWETF